MQEFAAINALRRQGWAIVTFAPVDLTGVDRLRFEERLDELGLDLLHELAIEGEDEE